MPMPTHIARTLHVRVAVSAEADVALVSTTLTFDKLLELLALNAYDKYELVIVESL